MSPKIPPLPYRELARLLRARGFRAIRQKGSHETWTDGIRYVTIPRHAGRIGPGLVKAVLEQAGIDPGDVRR